MKRQTATIIFILFILFAFIGCQTPAGRSAGNVVDDATITTKVKGKLLEDSILRGLAISVDTFEGEVTLTGAVDTSGQKVRATEVARSVEGVRKINNLLKIK